MTRGCNIGLDVITNPTNQFPFPNVELFNGSTIHIVQWQQDPECGIYRNQFNFTGKQCKANNRYGNIIEFDEVRDVNCSLPLDDYLIVLLLIVGLYSYFKIKTNYGTLYSNKRTTRKGL